MITLTAPNGVSFALNCDLIERVDAVPDTVITLVDGATCEVQESLAEVIDAVQGYRAAVVARCQDLSVAVTVEPGSAPLRLVIDDVTSGGDADEEANDGS